MPWIEVGMPGLLNGSISSWSATKSPTAIRLAIRLASCGTILEYPPVHLAKGFVALSQHLTRSIGDYGVGRITADETLQIPHEVGPDLASTTSVTSDISTSVFWVAAGRLFEAGPDHRPMLGMDACGRRIAVRRRLSTDSQRVAQG